jgi:hypothetical protein
MDITFPTSSLKPERGSSSSEERWQVTLIFHECEHGGDQGHYEDDVASAGGKVTDSRLNSSAETCTMVIEVDDIKEFLHKLSKTGSEGFYDVRGKKKI